MDTSTSPGLLQPQWSMIYFPLRTSGMTKWAWASQRKGCPSRELYRRKLHISKTVIISEQEEPASKTHAGGLPVRAPFQPGSNGSHARTRAPVRHKQRLPGGRDPRGARSPTGRARLVLSCWKAVASGLSVIYSPVSTDAYGVPTTCQQLL